MLLGGTNEIRNAMLRLLRGAGFQAEAYVDGSEFLAAAETHPPDCVVTDLHMPKMTGMQLLLHVRRMRSPPPVLVISGSGLMGELGHRDAKRPGQLREGQNSNIVVPPLHPTDIAPIHLGEQGQLFLGDTPLLP